MKFYSIVLLSLLLAPACRPVQKSDALNSSSGDSTGSNTLPAFNEFVRAYGPDLEKWEVKRDGNFLISDERAAEVKKRIAGMLNLESSKEIALLTSEWIDQGRALLGQSIVYELTNVKDKVYIFNSSGRYEIKIPTYSPYRDGKVEKGLAPSNVWYKADKLLILLYDRTRQTNHERLFEDGREVKIDFDASSTSVRGSGDRVIAYTSESGKKMKVINKRDDARNVSLFDDEASKMEAMKATIFVGSNFDNE